MRYKTEVKVFALKERSEGVTWPRIRQHIQERFGVPPPTPRAMEKWQKSLNPEAIKAEFMKDITAQMPRMIDQAKAEVGAGLLPVALKAKEAGEDAEAAAWNWFFQWVESWLGVEKFEKLVTGYLQRKRDAKHRS